MTASAAGSCPHGNPMNGQSTDQSGHAALRGASMLQEVVVTAASSDRWTPRSERIVTFAVGHVPMAAVAVTAGFNFDAPVRFDTDHLEVDLSALAAGAIPKIPLVKIRA